jgi:hypothetical protein
MPSSIFTEVDWFAARCMVLNAVKEVGAKCWGSESRVMVEVERDDVDMKAILKSMAGKSGTAGMGLRKTGRNLKRVAGYVFDLVGLVSADYGLFDFWAMDNWGRAEREEMR